VPTEITRAGVSEKSAIGPAFRFERRANAFLRVRGSRWCRTLLALVAIAWPRPARAEPMAVAIVVDGPNAKAVRGIVVEALPTGTNPISESAFGAALARQGLHKPFGRAIDPAAIAEIRKAALAMGVDAVVVVRVRGDRSGRRAQLLVVDARNSDAPVGVPVRLKSHKDDVNAVGAELRRSLSTEASRPSPPGSPTPPTRTAVTTPTVSPPPAPPSPEPAPHAGNPGAPDAPAAAAPTVGQRVATSLFDLSIGGDVAGRQFTYVSGILPQARDYLRFPAPAWSVRGELFPFAWRNVGFTAEYLKMFAGANGAASPATFIQPAFYAVGLRYRVHPGDDPRVIVGFSVAYARTAFDRVGPQSMELPGVIYRSVRPTIDVRVPFGAFSITAMAGFHAIINAGSISTTFYSPSGYGYDGELGGALMVDPKFEVRLTAWYRRYAFAFVPPTASFGAGGSVDELYGARLALALVL
jgi:hypothetical protein